MRLRKIRGNNRRLKQLNSWLKKETTDNRHLIDEMLKKNGYWYSDIYVHPWCDISIINSVFPEPYGKIRAGLIQGLLKIYDTWKSEMDKRGEPYYLKIWLYEPRISKSQVVCAIGKRIEYYENLFENTQDKNDLSLLSNPVLDGFQWQVKDDHDVHWEQELLDPIEFYESEEAYNETVRIYSRLQSGKIKSIQKIYSGQNAFLVKRGHILVGSR